MAAMFTQCNIHFCLFLPFATTQAPFQSLVFRNQALNRAKGGKESTHTTFHSHRSTIAFPKILCYTSSRNG
jgi:hypothetical protein